MTHPVPRHLAFVDQGHSRPAENVALVDVISEHAELVITRLAGIRVKGETLKPAIATEANRTTE